MKKKRYTIAKDAIGFVEREVWQPETPEEQSEALRLTLGAKPKSWGIRDEVAEIRDLIDTALSGMGLPRSHEYIAISEKGDWRPIASPDDLREGEKPVWSFLWIDRAAKPLSEEYFLGKMAFEIESIEHAIERGDMLGLFRHAGRLGMHQTEIDVRRIALRYAEKGQQFSEPNKGTQKRTAERRDFLRQVADEIGTNNRKVVADACVSRHAGKVRKLWRSEGEKARSKLLSFMNNNKIP